MSINNVHEYRQYYERIKKTPLEKEPIFKNIFFSMIGNGQKNPFTPRDTIFDVLIRDILHSPLHNEEELAKSLNKKQCDERDINQFYTNNMIDSAVFIVLLRRYLMSVTMGVAYDDTYKDRIIASVNNEVGNFIAMLAITGIKNALFPTSKVQLPSPLADADIERYPLHPNGELHVNKISESRYAASIRYAGRSYNIEKSRVRYEIGKGYVIVMHAVPADADDDMKVFHYVFPPNLDLFNQCDELILKRRQEYLTAKTDGPEPIVSQLFEDVSTACKKAVAALEKMKK